jgi:hypothetical protein
MTLFFQRMKTDPNDARWLRLTDRSFERSGLLSLWPYTPDVLTIAAVSVSALFHLFEALVRTS